MSRILIADDHKSTREGLALALGGLGHSIHVAFDGEDAIAAVGKYSFDLAHGRYPDAKEDRARSPRSHCRDRARNKCRNDDGFWHDRVGR